MTRRILLVWGRRLALLLAAITAGLLARKLDVEKLPPEVASLDGVVRRGATVVFMTVSEHTALGEGSLVEAIVQESSAAPKRGILSRVEGKPGQQVRLVPGNPGELVIEVDGRRLSARAEAKACAIPAGAIPDGQYLLVNPSRDAIPRDSREFGLFPRARITRKIISSF